MSLHSVSYSNALFWFWAEQSLFLLLSASCLAEKQQIPISKVSVFTRPELESTIYRTWSEHAYHNTTDVVTIKYFRNN